MTDNDLQNDSEHKRLAKLRVQFVDGEIAVGIDDIYDEQMKAKGHQLIIESKETQIVLSVISNLIVTDTEKLTKEQKEILTKCSIVLLEDGFYRDENTNIILGHQDQIEEICQKIYSVSDESQTKEELEALYERLAVFSANFAKAMINPSDDGN